MHFVLDASVAIAWFFEDEGHASADAAFGLMAEGGEALAPLLLWFELGNAILLGIRRNRIVQARAAEIFARLHRAAIGFDAIPETHDAVFTLAQRHRLTFYDACYLELAQRTGAPLATLDRALVRAASMEGVPLIGASPA
jgi:predicted nucleic acid-binding protein